MKALKSTHAAPAPGASEGELHELVRHCALHAADGACGYAHMNSHQQSLYDAIVGRRLHAGAMRIARSVAKEEAAGGAALWRSCEFCGCRTNAAERVCCRRGRDTDRRQWSLR